ncbi:MAG TPA: hypothetical protein VIR15_15675 [Intrasporangium sp.]|jgi:hypothetical protein|uniref:hypothetical protein n=1 Tax=Intrasporangium sp. TaxID=1925024 RepID=UPI002F921146
MSRMVGLVLGAVFVVLGLVWFGQGMGWIGGSGMSGVRLWAVIGPILAAVGVVLVVGSLRPVRVGRHRDP